MSNNRRKRHTMTLFEKVQHNEICRATYTNVLSILRAGTKAKEVHITDSPFKMKQKAIIKSLKDHKYCVYKEFKNDLVDLLAFMNWAEGFHRDQIEQFIDNIYNNMKSIGNRNQWMKQEDPNQFTWITKKKAIPVSEDRVISNVQYVAFVGFSGNQVQIGSFSDEQEAHNYRNKFLKEVYETKDGFNLLSKEANVADERQKSTERRIIQEAMKFEQELSYPSSSTQYLDPLRVEYKREEPQNPQNNIRLAKSLPTRLPNSMITTSNPPTQYQQVKSNPIPKSVMPRASTKVQSGNTRSKERSYSRLMCEHTDGRDVTLFTDTDSKPREPLGKIIDGRIYNFRTKESLSPWQFVRSCGYKKSLVYESIYVIGLNENLNAHGKRCEYYQKCREKRAKINVKNTYSKTELHKAISDAILKRQQAKLHKTQENNACDSNTQTDNKNVSSVKRKRRNSSIETEEKLKNHVESKTRKLSKGGNDEAIHPLGTPEKRNLRNQQSENENSISQSNSPKKIQSGEGKRSKRKSSVDKSSPVKSKKISTPERKQKGSAEDRLKSSRSSPDRSTSSSQKEKIQKTSKESSSPFTRSSKKKSIETVGSKKSTRKLSFGDEKDTTPKKVSRSTQKETPSPSRISSRKRSQSLEATSSPFRKSNRNSKTPEKKTPPIKTPTKILTNSNAQSTSNRKSNRSLDKSKEAPLSLRKSSRNISPGIDEQSPSKQIRSSKRLNSRENQIEDTLSKKNIKQLTPSKKMNPENLIQTWRNEIKVGDSVDFQDTDGHWWIVDAIEIKERRNAETRVLIQYQGLIGDKGQWISLNSERLQPLNSQKAQVAPVLCSACNNPGKGKTIVACDDIQCNTSFHFKCIVPKLVNLPKKWLCPDHVRRGRTRGAKNSPRPKV